MKNVKLGEHLRQETRSTDTSDPASSAIVAIPTITFANLTWLIYFLLDKS